MRITAALTVLALTGALSACSTEAEMRAVDPAAESPSASTGAGATAPAPASDGLVRTPGLVTVLDSGSGPQMCLGPVTQSLPPQCNGEPMTEFDWGDGAQEVGGVKWGSYALTGTFDGTTFTATDSIPAALYDAAATPDRESVAPACESPTSTDPSQATPEAMDATFNAAAALPGYAISWLTGKKTINVAVTEDAAGAEATLRETWGGPLCVTTAEHTEAELNAIGQELQAALPTLLSSGAQKADSIEASVVFDDGSIQAWADQAYGEGLVSVVSFLVPAS